MNETINKVDILGQTRNVAFNAMWPVGVTYTQYPGQKSPQELWPTAEYGCTWEEQKYGGAFFRTEGGNAKSFGQCSVEVTTLDKLNFTFVGSDPGGWAVGDHVIADGEDRTIAAAITNGFKVNEAFTTSKNITNVTVLQVDQNKSHNHPMPHTHTRGTMNITGTLIGTCYPNNSGWSGDWTGAFYRSSSPYWTGSDADAVKEVWMYDAGFDASRTWSGNTSQPTNDNTSNSGGTESRPINSTYKIWLRTA